jgi:hypothetical protein
VLCVTDLLHIVVIFCHRQGCLILKLEKLKECNFKMSLKEIEPENMAYVGEDCYNSADPTCRLP